MKVRDSWFVWRRLGRDEDEDEDELEGVRMRLCVIFGMVGGGRMFE